MHSDKMGLWILQLKVHFSKGIIKNHHNCYLRFAFLIIEHFQKSTSLIMYLNFHLINYKSSSVVFLFEVSCFCLHQAPFKYLSIPPILLLCSVFAHLWNENREKCVRLPTFLIVLLLGNLMNCLNGSRTCGFLVYTCKSIYKRIIL